MSENNIENNNNELSQSSENASSNLKKCGTKEEVYNGLAEKTSGGLTKDNLMQNKKGKIVSKKKYEHGLKAFQNIKKNNDQLSEIKEEDLHNLDPLHKESISTLNAKQEQPIDEKFNVIAAKEAAEKAIQSKLPKTPRRPKH